MPLSPRSVWTTWIVSAILGTTLVAAYWTHATAFWRKTRQLRAAKPAKSPDNTQDTGHPQKTSPRGASTSPSPPSAAPPQSSPPTKRPFKLKGSSDWIRKDHQNDIAFTSGPLDENDAIELSPRISPDMGPKETSKRPASGAFTDKKQAKRKSSHFQKHPRIQIVYGSSTGTAEQFANDLETFLTQRRQQYRVNLSSMDAHVARDTVLAESGDLILFIIATHGEGDPPPHTAGFFSWLTTIHDLTHLRYAILGLGDSHYPRFNQAAKLLETRLRSKGAHSVCPIKLLDEAFDNEVEFRAWFETVFQPYVAAHCEVDSVLDLSTGTQLSWKILKNASVVHNYEISETSKDLLDAMRSSKLLSEFDKCIHQFTLLRVARSVDLTTPCDAVGCVKHITLSLTDSVKILSFDRNRVNRLQKLSSSPEKLECNSSCWLSLPRLMQCLPRVLHYTTGASIEIVAPTPDEVIERFFRAVVSAATNETGAKTYRLEDCITAKEGCEVKDHLSFLNLSLRDYFKFVCDLQGQVSCSLLERLALFLPHPQDQHRLTEYAKCHHLVSQKLALTITDMIEAYCPRANWCDSDEAFLCFLSLFPRKNARVYTIASSSNVEMSVLSIVVKNEVHFSSLSDPAAIPDFARGIENCSPELRETVEKHLQHLMARTNFPTSRQGQCSSHLCGVLNDSSCRDHVLAKIVPHPLKFRYTQSLILISAGVGIASTRAVLQHLGRKKVKPSLVKPPVLEQTRSYRCGCSLTRDEEDSRIALGLPPCVVVLTGHRSPKKDTYFGNELREWAETSPLAMTHYWQAFSREPPSTEQEVNLVDCDHSAPVQRHRYVHEYLVTYKELIRDLVCTKGAHIQVCGSKKLGVSVQKTLAELELPETALSNVAYDVW